MIAQLKYGLQVCAAPPEPSFIISSLPWIHSNTDLKSERTMMINDLLYDFEKNLALLCAPSAHL